MQFCPQFLNKSQAILQQNFQSLFQQRYSHDIEVLQQLDSTLSQLSHVCFENTKERQT